MLRRLVFGLLTTAFLSLCVTHAYAQYQCDPAVCTLPDCHCASVNPPGGLAPHETPQFILVTFDDGVSAYWESFVTELLKGLQNPGGRKTLRTYFVNVKDSNPKLIRSVYDAGHEIASHTASHATGSATSAAQWRDEIRQLEEFLALQAGIPAGDVVGFRAPYLETNEDLWRALGELNLLYDSSVSEQPTTPPIVSLGLDQLVWPHTMDAGLALSCFASRCPQEAVPGLWTIPMWAHYEDLSIPPHGMDPYAGFPDRLRKSLRLGFDERYNGNRAPFGLYLHRGPLAAYAEWTAELRSFLEDAMSRPDVWMITMRGLIEWMKNPVPVERMESWFDAGCYQGTCAVGQMTVAETMLPQPELSAPHPNPFRTETTVAFSLPRSAHVRVGVYDMLGRRVMAIADGWRAAGVHETIISGQTMPAGAYVAVLEVGDRRITRMIVATD